MINHDEPQDHRPRSLEKQALAQPQRKSILLLSTLVDALQRKEGSDQHNIEV